MKLRNRLPFFLRLLNRIRTLFGIPPLTLTNAKAGNILGLTAYGGLEQNGTPTPNNPVPLVCNNGEIKVDSGGNIYTDGLQETLRIVESNSTATTEMLLKLGNYVDSQDILRGVVNRQLGIKVFDGTESVDWSLDSSGGYCRFGYSIRTTQDASDFKTTHFLKGTVGVVARNKMSYRSAYTGFLVKSDNTTSGADFKQWLLDQYNNGTPLILVYQLTDSQTESATPQPLTVVEGDNTLEIQQASLNNLEVEVTYEEK